MRIKKQFILFAIILVIILWLGFLAKEQQKEPELGFEKDYGLYWYGRNQTSQKAEPGVPNPYYDPNKPVVIFVHGWTPMQADTPPTFLFNVTDDEHKIEYNIDLAEKWLQDGWNIGIYYWHPFADEDEVWDAEDKIWTADSVNKMRWRDAEGNYHTENMPTQSASKLFYDDYISALEGYNGNEIRLAGHSLGNQMATLLILQTLEGIEAGEVASNLLPSRLTLLDPFWSPLSKDYLDGERTGTILRRDILQKIIPQGTAVEWIRSSLLTEASLFGEYTVDLQMQTPYTELAPEFCGPIDQVCRHDAAWKVYFLSYGDTAPQECIAAPGSEFCVGTSRDVPMAQMPTNEILELMPLPYGWIQVRGPDEEDGRITPQTNDDWFTRIEIEKDE